MRRQAERGAERSNVFWLAPGKPGLWIDGSKVELSTDRSKWLQPGLRTPSFQPTAIEGDQVRGRRMFEGAISNQQRPTRTGRSVASSITARSRLGGP